MGGRDQPQEFGVGWGWPQAGPQDTVWLECWPEGGFGLSLVSMGAGILGPDPLGPQFPCVGQTPSCWLR